MSTDHKKILIVEDEPAISQVCLIVLTGEGFEVDVAADADVAQKMLGKKDYDLCLIDIKIPVMTGKELYQVIIKKYPNLVNGVIFTTGDVMNEYTQRFLLELAGRPYLLKPFTIDELINTVRETARQIEK
ncbi:unnamed protein product [marine sediment metagenome]|uniref:Response regulatory domain-containing protein n=1 Tax=marine sediment metagenome TaxID=412755 RepID=X1VFT5_9ZZZZ